MLLSNVVKALITEPSPAEIAFAKFVELTFPSDFILSTKFCIPSVPTFAKETIIALKRITLAIPSPKPSPSIPVIFLQKPDIDLPISSDVDKKLSNPE